MTIPLVDLGAQYRDLRVEIDAAIAAVLGRGDFILGREVGAFEAAFAAFVGTRHCVGVASGTDALRLAMVGLGVGPGDEVLVPANSFIATALAVSEAGATPVFVDVDPKTYTIDADCARRAVTPRSRAVVPVHLYGQPADMEEILALSGKHNLIIIEDAAQAHGAVHHLGRVGTLGAASGFSFYPGKNLGAYGDAGAVATDDEALADHLRKLRNWGSTVKYEHPERGCNSRLDTIQAAVLLVKLRHLEDANARRRTVAGWYDDMLESLADRVQRPIVADWTREHVYHLYVVRLRDGVRDMVLHRLHAAGIGAGVHYPTPIHLQGAYAAMGHRPGDYPEAEAAAREVLSLPMYPELTRDQVAQVVRALEAALG